MRYLKLFENHQTEAEVAEICKKNGIINWTLNSDGLVDVNANVNLKYMKYLTDLPLKFGEVTGSFYCNRSVLTTLEGAPHTVGGNFDVEHNKLTSLEFSPKSVGGIFWCSYNNIRSFEGLVHISEDFYCKGNPLYNIWKIINPINDNAIFDQSERWDSEKMDFFNDLEIIRGEEIAIERLNFFLEEIGLDTVEEVKGYKNIY